MKGGRQTKTIRKVRIGFGFEVVLIHDTIIHKPYIESRQNI